MPFVRDPAGHGVAGSKLEHGDRTRRPVDALAVAPEADVQKPAEQQPQHGLVGHDQDVPGFVARAQIVDGGQRADRDLEGRFARRRADHRVIAPARVARGIADGGLLLRQPLPVAEVHFIQARIAPGREPEAGRERRGRRDGAPPCAGYDPAPMQAVVGVGELLGHQRAGGGQRRVDVATESIATAELGFTMS